MLGLERPDVAQTEIQKAKSGVEDDAVAGLKKENLFSLFAH